MATHSGSADFRWQAGVTLMDFCVQWLEAGNPPALGGGSNIAFEVEAGQTIRLAGSMVMPSTGSPDNTGTMELYVSTYEDNSNTVVLSNQLLISQLNPVYGTTYSGSATWVVPKAGTYRIRCRGVFNDTSDLNDFDGHSDSTTPTVATGTWNVASSMPRRNQGYLRAGISPSITVSNSYGGSTPSTFAWPDEAKIRLATGFNAVAMTSNLQNMDVDILASNGTTEVYDSNILGATASTNWDATSVLLDTQLANDSFGVRIDQLDNSSFSGRPWTHFHTVPSGWAGGGTDGGANTTKDVSITRSDFSWNSAITIDQLTAPDGIATVFNRGERCPASGSNSIRVRNARSEGFTPRGGTNKLISIKTSDSTQQERNTSDGSPFNADLVIDSVDTGTGVITFHTTFDSTCTGTTDGTGEPKSIMWRDSNGSGTVTTNSPTPANTSQYAEVDSTYVVAPHLQLNSNLLDPAKNTTQRLTSDLGFVSVKVTNRRNQAVNGAQGSLRLRDDASLVSALAFDTLTTAAQNGNNGYVPLQTWDSALPGGGWDLYTSADGGVNFTKDGNTGTLTRKTVGATDFSLLAINPNIRVIVGAGVAYNTLDGDHWHPGDDLLAGLAVVNFDTDIYIRPDDSPVPAVIIGRFNTVSQRGEYLAADGTWTPLWTVGTLKTITGATNTSPIEVTCASHGYSTGDEVCIHDVGGNTATNGAWIITVTGTNTFTLSGSTGNGTYTSGGEVEKGVATSFYEWPLTQACDPPFDSHDIRVFLTVIPGSTSSPFYNPGLPNLRTDLWGEAEIFVIGKAYVSGTPYTGPSQLETVAKLNNHDRYKFDGPGFVGFPTR